MVEMVVFREVQSDCRPDEHNVTNEPEYLDNKLSFDKGQLEMQIGKH